MRHDYYADGFVRAEHFSEPGFQPAGSRKQPEHLQRRVVVENARHHAGHRLHRPAGGAGLHGEHLLDFPRQGEARPDELLKT